MKVTPTELPEVLLIEPKVHGDSRGFFAEMFQARRYTEAGVPGPFVQDNLSRSVRGTLRGLHFQEPKPQGKLVQVLRGTVWDVAVDVRRGSPRFGRWVAMELSESAPRQLWIPPGFAHGFLVLSDAAEFLYKTTDYWYPEFERTLLWSDPALGVAWPLGDAPTVAAQDAAGRPLAVAEVYP